MAARAERLLVAVIAGVATHILDHLRVIEEHLVVLDSLHTRGVAVRAIRLGVARATGRAIGSCGTGCVLVLEHPDGISVAGGRLTDRGQRRLPD